jgi:hypothetical protein
MEFVIHTPNGVVTGFDCDAQVMAVTEYPDFFKTFPTEGHALRFLARHDGCDSEFDASTASVITLDEALHPKTVVEAGDSLAATALELSRALYSIQDYTTDNPVGAALRKLESDIRVWKHTSHVAA